MAKDGFEVELDDLSTFTETVQRAGEDFRDTGLQTLSALSQFAMASGLSSTAILADMSRLSSNHMDSQLAASQVLMQSFMGLSTLSMGARVIRNSYGTADGQGADALQKIDGDVVDKMFAPPKAGDTADGGDGSAESNNEAYQDTKEFLERQGQENIGALNGAGQTYVGGDYYIDSYNGSTVVTVPEQGGQPATGYESPAENELGPDLPEIDKYNEIDRYEDSNDIRFRLPELP